MLFDRSAQVVEGSIVRRAYQVRTTRDGGAELDAREMFETFASALDEVVERSNGTKIIGVATSSLASSILAVDERGDALTPIYLYSDTRDAGAVEELRAQIDWAPIYERTGCPLHTSYLPARLWWLRQTQPQVFTRAARWLSLHELLLSKLFGQSMISHSLASWTGLENRTKLDWDDRLLELIGINRDQLSPMGSMQDSFTQLRPEYASRWKSLVGASFFPALGDGAAANIGSGCTDSSQIAITMGTSGAVRVVVPGIKTPNTSLFHIPQGLWLYHVDERRGLLGGSLNNGGNSFAYLRRTLALPDPKAEESELDELAPDSHGLTVLPFFAGERSPGYHGDARAVIAGLNLETKPIEILRATFEAVAYRVAAIFDLILTAISAPRAIIASGSALLNSPAWVQIIADVLERPVLVSGEEEATARGAALLALEACGAIRDAGELPSRLGRMFSPETARQSIYRHARDRQQQLYSLLVARG